MNRKFAALGCVLSLLIWLIVHNASRGAERPPEPLPGEWKTSKTLPVQTAYESIADPPAEPTSTSGTALEPEQAPLGTEDEASDESHFIDVPLISQLPELYNGCEITSLAMLLEYLQHPVDKLDLAEMLPKDETPAQLDEDGTILVWGDPDQGFVGNIYGDDLGYGVNVKPIAYVLEQLYAPGALDLTGRDFSVIEKTIAKGKPVIIWNIASFEQSDAWVTWKTPAGKDVEATFQEHCVLMVGFDDDYVYVNNPFEGIQAQAVAKWSFIEAWEQMGSKALTYKD